MSVFRLFVAPPVLRVPLGEGALCLVDPELHEGPVGSESSAERAAREDVAREVCGECPLWEACLAYAQRVVPESGIWAGLSAARVAELAEDVAVFGDVEAYRIEAA